MVEDMFVLVDAGDHSVKVAEVEHVIGSLTTNFLMRFILEVVKNIVAHGT